MTTSNQTTHELSCPNCGAPYNVPKFGNQAECAYCGARFLLPASLQTAAPAEKIETPDVTTLSPQAQESVKHWVKWLVIFIVVVTVVPTVCGILASVCGAFGAFVPFFMR